jgi:hypothetical protein
MFTIHIIIFVLTLQTFFIPYALNTLKMNKLQTPSSHFTFVHRTIDYQQLRYILTSQSPTGQSCSPSSATWRTAEWMAAIVEDTVVLLLPNERGARNHQSP